jgi:hypothetical protein
MSEETWRNTKLHVFPNIAIRLVWLSGKALFIGFVRLAVRIASAASCLALLEIREPHTIKN